MLHNWVRPWYLRLTDVRTRDEATVTLPPRIKVEVVAPQYMHEYPDLLLQREDHLLSHPQGQDEYQMLGPRSWESTAAI